MQATTIRPYWQSDDGSLRVYHARTGDAGPAYAHLPDVLVELADELRGCALVHADPPYGTGQRFNRGGIVGAVRRRTTAKAPGKVRAWAPLAGDAAAFDPGPLIALERPLVAWGGNYYGSRLPDETGWILWDKRDGTICDDGADGELAWTNLGGALRIFRHAWRGLARASETGTAHLHPTQKPEALVAWVFRERAKLKPGALVFVPYAGSCPELAVCASMGLRCIAVDVSRDYLDTAIGARLGAVTSERAAEPAGPLFTSR